MLSPSQIAEFRENGYLIVEDVIDAATRDAVLDEYETLLGGLYEGWSRQGLVPPPEKPLNFWEKLDRCRSEDFDWYQPLDISLPFDNIGEETPMHFGPAVFDLVRHDAILDMMECLVGPEITSNPIQHVRIKPPERTLPEGEARAHVSYTNWHQDRGVGHADADDSTIVTVWVAMTDATEENGCLQVVPGLPKTLYPHCPKRQTTIADGFVDAARAIPAEVPAGGVILLHPLTPHCSLPNRSDGYRWSFDLRYNVTGQPTGRDQFPGFVARSRSHPDSELHDWRAWRQRWEAARLHLAHVPHIPQHRWQGDAPHCA